MNKFFDSLKGDLLDRRLMPLLALAGAALLAAIVYAVLASSGSSPATSASATPPVTPAAGIPVSAVKSESESGVNETTSGVPKAAASSTHNPFKPLPEPKVSTTSSSSSAPAGAGAGAGGSGSSGSESAGSGSSNSGSAGSSGSSGSSESSGSGGQPSGSTKPKKKAQPKSQTLYAVAVLLGTAVPGTPAPNAELTLYEGLKLKQPLPSAQLPLVVYRGVTGGGKGAVFTLVGELIPHGSAQCLPSATQCQTITVKPGETEELEYVPLGGTPVNYELYVVAIDSVKSTSEAFAKGASARISAVGSKLLLKDGLQRIPGLRYSLVKGTLVPAEQHPLAALAARASWGTASSG